MPKHKHHDVIVAWAKDTSQKLQCLHPGKDWIDLGPHETPEWLDNLEYRIKPARAYPETQMTKSDFDNINCDSEGYRSGIHIANAALRHAIDAGQVAPMAEELELAREMNRRRYARAERARQQRLDEDDRARSLENQTYTRAQGEEAKAYGRGLWELVRGVS
mgnify:CR=1 FL=1